MKPKNIILIAGLVVFLGLISGCVSTEKTLTGNIIGLPADRTGNISVQLVYTQGETINIQCVDGGFNTRVEPGREYVLWVLENGERIYSTLPGIAKNDDERIMIDVGGVK